MEINWHGQSCFTIKAKEGTIVTDPFGGIGLKEPKDLKADVCLVTHDHSDHNNIKIVKGINDRKPVVISGPGEYEVAGINITGVKSEHSEEGKDILNTIYVFKAEGIALCHLGDLGQKSLTDSQLESLNGVDILMIPVGGTYTIDGKEAAEIINQIEPKIVIPMHYKIEGLTINLSGVEDFAKNEGVSASAAKDVLKVSQMNLPADDREAVILKAK